MSGSLKVCRLCLNTESLATLVDLFEMDGDISDISLSDKISSCVDVKISPQDSLPLVICDSCKSTINQFYDFKLNCLAVEKQLKKVSPLKPLYIDDLRQETQREAPKNEDQEVIDKPSEMNDFTDDLIDVFGFSPLVNSLIEDNFESQTEQNSHIEKNTTSEPTGKSNKEIQCELCGCIFLTKSEFKKHSSIHNSPVKLVKCKYCPKKFTRAENATIHMRSHLGIRPFVCDICGQTANKIQTLKRHMKIHSDERSHACPQCGCRFKRSGDLCTHMRTHTGARPYKCTLCESDYTSHSGLRKHFKTRHKNIPDETDVSHNKNQS